MIRLQFHVTKHILLCGLWNNGWLVSWLVGALSPVNHKGLHNFIRLKSWKQKSIHFLTIPPIIHKILQNPQTSFGTMD